MTRRLYPTRVLITPIAPAVPGWDRHATETTTYKAVSDPADAAGSTPSSASSIGSYATGSDFMYRALSAPLPGGTIGGTIKICLRAKGNSSLDTRLAARVLVFSSTGNLRAVPLPVTPGENRLPSVAASVIETFALDPVATEPGDRITVELGFMRYTSSTSAYNQLWIGIGTTSDYEAAGDTDSAKRPWIEFSQDIYATPPAPPTNLTQVGATDATATISWTPPAPAPTGYEVRINGGAPVQVGDVTQHTLTGLAPATTYVVDVRSVNAAGVSAWTAGTVTTGSPPAASTGIASLAVLKAAGLNPTDPANLPAQQWHYPDSGAWYIDDGRSALMLGYSITYGARNPTERPQPLAATVQLAVAVEDQPQIGETFQIRLAETLAAALGPINPVRFTGMITDVELEPTRRWTTDAGTYILATITATGKLPRYGAAPIQADPPWPREPVGQRVNRILIALGLDGDVDEGGALVDVVELPASYLDALQAAADSAAPNLIEQRTGVVDLPSQDARRGTLPLVEVAARQILADGFSWRQSVTDTLNQADVEWAGGIATVADPASVDPVTGPGPYPARIKTILVDEPAAYAYAGQLVGRRAWPTYQLPAVTIDLARSGLTRPQLAALLNLRHGDRIALTGMPPGSPWEQTPRGCFVEGIVETATPRAWRLQIVVSDPTLSGVSIRWVDLDEAPAWSDLNPALSWLDFTRIEDPTDL